MTSYNKTLITTCPTCDYLHGKPGQPAYHPNGSMTCNICNSQWREINGTRSSSQQNSAPGAISPSSVVDISMQAGPMQPWPKQRRFIPKNSGIQLSTTTLSAVIFCTILVWVAVLAYQKLPSGNSAQLVKSSFSSLMLDNVKVETHKNNHAGFWTVTARITNRSANSITLPPILMMSGTKGSSGYFSRTYTPALQKLAPGTNLIIRTSIHRPFGSSRNIQLKFAANHSKSG